MNWTLTETEQSGRWKLAGSLEIYSVAPLREQLLQLIEQGNLRKLDLSEVNSCDTASLQVLLASQKMAKEAGNAQPFENPSAELNVSCAALGVCESWYSVQ